MGFLKYLKLIRESNTAFVAVTRKCNCRCHGCDMWKGHDEIDAKRFASLLPKLYDSGFRLIEFTGGEPVLMEDVYFLIKESKKYGFFVQLMTNGTLIDGGKSRKLAASGVDMVCISVDCHDDKRASMYRGFRNINKKIRESVSSMREHGILMSSTTLITKHNFHDIEKTVEFVNNELGIYFSFCPPDSAENYMLGSHKDSVSPGKEELIEVFERMRELKKSGCRILNTHAYINDAIRWLKGEKIKYACKAGKNIIYIDWMMNVYPCFVKQKICSLDAFNKNFLNETDCNLCCFQCFREPSIFYHTRGKIAFMRDIGTLLSAANKSGFFRK